MRTRTLKPEFFSDALMLRLTLAEARAYQWLWCDADDAGRVQLDEYRLKAGCFPVYEQTVQDCAAMLTRLVDLGRLVPYEVNGQRYAVIVHFWEHQRPNPAAVKPGGSWKPAPPLAVAESIPGYCEEMGRILGGSKLCDELRSVLWPYGIQIRSGSDPDQIQNGQGLRGSGAQFSPPGVPPASGGECPRKAAPSDPAGRPGPERERPPRRRRSRAEPAYSTPELMQEAIAEEIAMGLRWPDGTLKSERPGGPPATPGDLAQEAGQVAEMVRTFDEVCGAAGLRVVAWRDLGDNDVGLLRHTALRLASGARDPCVLWRRLCERAATTPLCRGEVGDGEPWNILRLAQGWRTLDGASS